ncbi:MAG: hypothetical protein IJO57_04410 [Bacilli bacterium]|nr:hypothetical protein [Bacilli bacterium]
MNREDLKKELINRYMYIYENAEMFLAPYLKKEEDNYVINIDNKLLYLIEEFLLSDINYKETNLYSLNEMNKNNKEYLKKVKEGLILLQERNSKYHKLLEETLNIYKILEVILSNLKGDNKKNLELKTKALDEYFKINRYDNTGTIWTSGYSLNYKDYQKNGMSIKLGGAKEIAFISDKKKQKTLKLSTFIEFLSDNNNKNKDNDSILTEKEKQQIYLHFHDELAWNTEIECDIEKRIYPDLVESRIYMPNYITPCKNKFYINESEIFIKPNDHLFKYYQACPHCGYLVNIPNSILPDKVKERIEERCSKDKYLYRKMYLYSELYQLNEKSSEEQKEIMKKTLHRLTR